jgi:hypothetical protein
MTKSTQKPPHVRFVSSPLFQNKDIPSLCPRVCREILVYQQSERCASKAISEQSILDIPLASNSGRLMWDVVCDVIFRKLHYIMLCASLSQRSYK